MNTDAPRKRAAFSIRLKLIIAIVVLISAFAAGALALVQRALEESYRRTFDEQFQREMDSFIQRRHAQNVALRGSIANAASSVRLLAAAYAGDGSRLYADLAFALSDLMRARARGGDLPFLRFVNADGTMLASEEAGAGRIPGLEESALAAALEPMAATASARPGDHSGFAVLGKATDRRLYTITIVPLVDVSTDEVLGEIFFGHPVSSVSRLVGKSGTGAGIGLLVEDRLYSDTIPADVEAALLGSAADRATDTVRVADVEHVAIRRLLSPGGRFAQAEYVALFSLAGLQSTLVEIRGHTIGFVVVALGIAVLLSIPLAARFTRPIGELVAATDEVQRGNLDVTVPVHSRDELGVLSDAFNAMTSDLALKDQYRDLLDKVTDPEIADELLSGKIELGGARCEAAVLFCDVRGFTPFTREVPAETLLRLLNEHMTAMTEVVARHGGVVDKFVGDEIVAVFGVPRRSDSMEADVVACAIDMLDTREDMNPTASHPWEVGIGIASGPMIAGCIGSEQRLSYTVIGEQVNLGSRLCSAAGPRQILIDTTTRNALGDSVPLRTIEALALKGIDEPLTAYEVLHETT